MRIVIDIPEEKYQGIINIAEEILDASTFCSPRYLYKAVLDGTPIPKGCGRLGDLDALEQEMINGIKTGNYEEGYEQYAHINDMDDCIDCVRYADTIIEVDKGDRSDK